MRPAPMAGLAHHSALSDGAVGVRAAVRPGHVATRLARTSPPTTTMATVTAGTVGAGTTWISPAKASQSVRAERDPERRPDHDADSNRHRRLPGHRGGQLAPGESEGLEKRQIPAAAAHRRYQGEAERGDRGAEPATPPSRAGVVPMER